MRSRSMRPSAERQCAAGPQRASAIWRESSAEPNVGAARDSSRVLEFKKGDLQCTRSVHAQLLSQSLWLDLPLLLKISLPRKLPRNGMWPGYPKMEILQCAISGRPVSRYSMVNLPRLKRLPMKHRWLSRRPRPMKLPSRKQNQILGPHRAPPSTDPARRQVPRQRPGFPWMVR